MAWRQGFAWFGSPYCVLLFALEGVITMVAVASVRRCCVLQESACATTCEFDTRRDGPSSICGAVCTALAGTLDMINHPNTQCRLKKRLVAELGRMTSPFGVRWVGRSQVSLCSAQRQKPKRRSLRTQVRPPSLLRAQSG